VHFELGRRRGGKVVAVMKALVVGQVGTSDHGEQTFPLRPLRRRDPHKAVTAAEETGRVDRARAKTCPAHAATAVQKEIVQIDTRLQGGQHVGCPDVNDLSLASALPYQQSQRNSSGRTEPCLIPALAEGGRKRRAVFLPEPVAEPAKGAYRNICLLIVAVRTGVPIGGQRRNNQARIFAAQLCRRQAPACQVPWCCIVEKHICLAQQLPQQLPASRTCEM